MLTIRPMELIRTFLKAHPGFLPNVPPALLGPMIALYGQMQYQKYGCTLRLRSAGRYIAIRRDIREIRLAFTQYPYLEDAMGEFDYFFAAVCPEEDDGLQVVDLSRPKVHRVPGLDIPYMCSGLPESVSTNEAYLAEFNLRAGDVVLDVGAYCGMSTVFFARAVGPSGAVLAVEADPQSFKCLQENAQASGLGNIKCTWAAIWHSAGTVEFQAEASLGSAVAAAGTRQDRTVAVPSMTLADAAASLGRPVTHIKMDVEGAEYRIIPESIAFLRSVRPTVIMEVHKAPNTNKIDAERICGIFSELGYKIEPVPHTAQHQVFPVLCCRPSAAVS